MKLEDQVCSLELAKKLKELGVKQESLFYWGTWGGGYSLGDVGDKGEWPDKPATYYSAYTVAELGEYIKEEPEYPYWIIADECWSAVSYTFLNKKDPTGTRLIGPDEDMECVNTEADARAKMLIYLIENKLLTL